MARGRPPKPTRQKELEGNPGKRPLNDQEIAVDGLPERPDGLSDDAAWLWKIVVDDLAAAGVAKRIDTAMLWSMCELWGLYRSAVRLTEGDPFSALDKDIRIAVTQYWSAFERAASKFGLDPSARSRLRAPTSAPASKLDKFGIVG